MSEVALHWVSDADVCLTETPHCKLLGEGVQVDFEIWLYREVHAPRCLQGYLAHKKQLPSLGPPSSPGHIPTVGS